MGKFGKKGQKLGGTGFIPKNILPGKKKCKVVSIRVNTAEWDNEEKLFLNLQLEEERPNEDFEGFYIDKENKKKGRHDGPSSSVSSNPFGYQDGKVKDKKNGGTVDKEMLAVQFLHRLCLEANGSTWAQDNLGKHETFEKYIAAFNKDNPIKGEYLYFIIQGVKDRNDEGYIEYRRLAVALTSKDERAAKLKSFASDEADLIDYDREKHVYDKTGGEEVDKFKGKDDTTSGPIEEEEEEDEDDVEFATDEADENEVFSTDDDDDNDDLPFEVD